ncbi:MAG TPA: OsmC family protein [Candidatus Limnocylindrales bacterium]|nr:OsmC family protein [Candidatus Limnocylindrales bacterium]
MRHVTVTWRPDEGRFDALGKNPVAIPVNAPHEGDPEGFSAADLLLAGVGACSGWDMVEILRKQRQDVTGVVVRVIGEQATEPPWAFGRIEVEYTVAGRKLRRRGVERAIRLSCDKYCSVIATVRGVATVVTSLVLVDADTAASADTGAGTSHAGADAAGDQIAPAAPAIAVDRA